MYRDVLPEVLPTNMNIRSRRILFSPIAATATLMLLSIIGCSGSDPNPEPTERVISASEAIEFSKSAMGDLDSFSFQLTHESGHTTLSGALELSRAGGLVATNGLDLEAEANIGRAFVRVEAVVIDEQTWMTNPLTGVWSEIPPEDSPFSFLDPVKLVADILGDTQDAEYAVESAPIGEYRISGNIPASALATLVGTVDPEAVPSIVLNINADAGVLKRVEISGKVQPEDDLNTVRIITLSEFNKQVSLEPPI